MKIKDLKKEKLINIKTCSNSMHCKMDIILEELFYLNNFNALVLGVNECCYFSKKINLNKYKNYSYLLTDNELVFGDLSQLEKTFEYFNSLKSKTVVIVTCIPSIMNLDIEGLILNKFNNLIYINAIDYNGLNEYDVLSDLIYKVFINETDIGVKDGISIYNYDSLSYKKTRKLLNNKEHHIYNKYYYKLFDNLLIKYPHLKIYDECSLYPNNKSYLESIDNAEIFNALNAITHILNKHKDIKYSLIVNDYIDFVVYLFNDFKVTDIYISNYNEFNYQHLKSFKDQDIDIKLDKSDLKGDIILDLSNLNIDNKKNLNKKDLVNNLYGVIKNAFN